MSVKQKITSKIIAKIGGISLFIFLMLFNIKIAFSANSTNSINLLGLDFSIFTSSTFASTDVKYQTTVNCTRYEGIYTIVGTRQKCDLGGQHCEPTICN
ncbi:MAG: hypothetical protein NTX22_01770 [Ignavibacteriales bacterium]|nr:hypothetical protein [Ignavibacteriales bacterium]